MTESTDRRRAFNKFIRSHRFGFLMAAIALIAVSVYVFLITPYENFLFSDMKSFWVRALERLNGEYFRDSQFQAWPPIYHIFLAELFRIFRAVGLESLIRLETGLVINIVAFAASVYAFQRLAVHWFERAEYVLITVLLYALGFPSLYFNAFLLSGNLGVPLMVAAMALICCRSGWWAVVGSGLLFALATAIRPSFGPYGLSFVFLFLARYRISWKFIARSAAFSAVFFAVVFAASLEVSRISGGRVNGLSANGGLDFFIANSHYHRIELNYDGWHFFIIVPGLSFKPENGVFYTNVPFYDQGHYFKLGWDFLKHDPVNRLLDNFDHVTNLFFADMLPSRHDAPGFVTLRPVWDWFKFLMFASFGLYFWTWRALGTRAPLFWLMTSTIGLTLIVSFFFTGEPRYTYSILFVFYLLFFKLVEQLQLDWHRWSRPLTVYGAILALGVTGSAAARYLATPTYEPTISFNLAAERPHSESDSYSDRFVMGRLLFPFKRKTPLVHADESAIRLDRMARVTMHSAFEYKGSTAQPVQFEINTAWPMDLKLDGQSILQVNEPNDFFREVVVVPVLTPGKHSIDLSLNYAPREGGVAVNYSYWIDGWRERKPFGVDAPLIDFEPIEETASK